MKTKTLQLTLTVTYNPGKESVQTLNNLLHNLVSRASGDGLLTGETTATVKDFEAKVVEVKPPKSKRKKMVRQHVMSDTAVPFCILEALFQDQNRLRLAGG